MPTLASCLCWLLIAWLLVRDVRRRRSVSAAVWIPVVLVVILGSRPVSLWLAGGGDVIQESGNAVQGMGNEASTSPFDQLFFLCTLAGSFLVAFLRKVKWMRLFAANPTIVLFYLYLAVSILWSGDPGGSVKRLLKDFGLVFVICVIYSEAEPLQAIRAVYVRCASVLLPLSVLLIKYFPGYSRIYDVNGDIQITGVTMQKNTLGELVLICMLFLLWDCLEALPTGSRLRWKHLPWDRLALFVTGAWLLKLSQSKTALMCLVIGSALMIARKRLASKTMNRAVLIVALCMPFLLFFSQQFASVIAPVVQALGRNMTFTGRANIWEHIDLKTVNPLIGAGYWNFWGGPGGYAISEVMKTTVPNAHNGYLDIYIDGGFIGLSILFAMLITCGRRIISAGWMQGKIVDRFMRVRFAFLIVAILHNLTESSFARMGLMWFTTLLMIYEFPKHALAARVQRAVPGAKEQIPDIRAHVLANR
jgi:exopolysaccharide production protein ExoQ